ncbi:14164_t:CDS:1, partial [Racocetra persica]
MPENEPILHSIYTGNDKNSSILVLELDVNNIWLIDSGSSRSLCYQYLRAAILKRKISNIKGIIVTNTHHGRLDGVTRFLKEFFSQHSNTDESQKLDCLVILTKEFNNEPIINILKDNGFDIINDFNDSDPIFENPNINMRCFFHDKGRPLVLKREKNIDQNPGFWQRGYENAVRYVANNTMINNYVNPLINNSLINNYVEINALARIFWRKDGVEPLPGLPIERFGDELFLNVQKNKSKAHVDLSSILTCLQYSKDGNIKTMLLTSDSAASWILEVITIKLKEHLQIQLNERPSIDVFQVPNYGSRINSIVGTFVDPPKHVNQQFALMMILYYGRAFDFTNLDDRAIVTIENDFEIMCNFSNFEIFEEAALLEGYIQTPLNLEDIKNFLKYMANALTVRKSEKDNNSNINWNWDEINWPEVGRKLYIIYKMNKETGPCHWPKYDFIKDVIDIPNKEFDPYFDNTKRGNISDEQLHVYFKSIKKRIRKNFDTIIWTNDDKVKHQLRYATSLKPLLVPLWHSLSISPLAFRYIANSISNFYNSFTAKTYVISSGSRHSHLDALVLVGIIKSILEDLKEKERKAMILLTNGSKVNMNLLASMIDDFLENKSNDVQKLLSQRIEIYTISDSSYEVSVKLSNGELNDHKSAQLLRWDSIGKEEIKKVTDILKRNKNLPNKPINKQIIHDIKISNHDQDPLWLNVDEEGNLAPSNAPVSFLISIMPYPDQGIIYQGIYIIVYH